MNRDPMDGLLIKPITPYPSFQGDVTQVAATQPPAPSVTQVQSSATVPPPVESRSPIGRKPSVLDSIVFAVLGPPDQILTPEAQAKKDAGRRKAGALAKSAAEDPGEAFMGIPSGEGGSLGETLGKLLSILR